MKDGPDPKMTDKLKEVLSSKQYQDPRLFTKTIYREDGSMIPEPDEEKYSEESYFRQFIPPEDAKRLALKLRLAERDDNEHKMSKRVDDPYQIGKTPMNTHIGRSTSESGVNASQYNWKTRTVRGVKDNGEND